MTLEFVGAESVERERLEEVVRTELQLLAPEELDKAAVDDAAFALELFYRSLGHHEVRVDYELRDDAEPPVARFQIDEGPIVRVGALEITGAEAVPEARVRERLAPVQTGAVYDQRVLDRQLAELATGYRLSGHLRFSYDLAEPVVDPATATVDLSLVLHEGPRFVVRDVDVEGALPELASTQANLVRPRLGRPYVPAIGHELEQALIAAYRRRGYPDVTVDVEAELDEASGDTRLVARIVPGELVRIARVRVEGNERTRGKTIRTLLRLDPGDVYAADEVRDAFRELYSTGLFESVELELEGEGPERTLVVRVVEARSLQIRLEPGYGSYEGPRILLAVEEQNFLGRGQIVQVEGTASALAQSARVSFIDRDLFGTRFTSETTFFAEQREEPSFEFARRGFNFFVRREWTDEWSSSTGYEFRPTDVTDDDFSVPLDPGVQDDTQVAALSAVVSFNDRDSILLPTRGQLARLRLEWADDGLGSDTEFLRAQLEYTRLLRLGGESALAASLRTGAIVPLGFTDEIPISERFFNGGENTVRSFEEDELLPPGQSGQSQGGEAATTFNLEYRRGLWNNLTGALFFDAGNVTEQVQDYLQFDGFRTGVGAGLRYLLPIGPVRLDLGWNPNAREEEDDFVLHFSVGFPF